ncbi:Cell division protein FtsL [Apilactobacillus kunkeei]|nr:Cell division protein FtsL [Apilactobacillus kunkeei]CAI2617073.1 Cell division protein FtsL [Apilactobacillus kunkeei]CAI2802606.1 Cell division protein FtsL [Apilactobacillus kunkeei]
MAQNNLANSVYAIPGYYSAGEQQKQQNPEVKSNVRLGLSKFEKTVVILGCSLVFFLMIGLVGEKISLGNHSAELQATTNLLGKVRDDNSTLKQEVSELQSGNRLQKIAKQADLSLSNKNVRNVSK